MIGAALRAANGAALVSLASIGSHWTLCEPRQPNLQTRVSQSVIQSFANVLQNLGFDLFPQCSRQIADCYAIHTDDINWKILA